MQSNGSLMRASPLALLNEKTSCKGIIEDAKITNPNKISVEINIIYVSILHFILKGMDKISIKETLRFLIKRFDKNIQEVIKQILSDKDERIITGKDRGWVLHAFYISFKAFFNYEKYEGAMDYVIGEHIGSDTDTNGAITGALFGAYLGFKKMNKEDKTKFNINKVEKYFDKIKSERKYFLL